MIKKNLTLLMASFLIFSAQETFAQSRKDKKKAATAAAAAAAKPETKPADTKKEPKPYNKVIDVNAVTQED